MTGNAARRVTSYFADPAEHSDADLLVRFVTDRDAEAFAALVRRHGPMVFGVCRRVLGDWHLAEDAFQAAFLVLAKRAAAVSPSGAVAGWLHGVAHRVALAARRSALRRVQQERTVEPFPDVPIEPKPTDPELREVLDDELRKLPGKYRQLLVACDLEGRPRQLVAEGLGIPEGTLSSRLTTARKMLANRLAKRGIAPLVVAGVAANGPPVMACEVPRVLLASTARIGADVRGTVPAGVAALAMGVIRAMRVSKLQLVGLVLGVVLLGLGIAYASGLLTPSLAPTNPPEPPKLAVVSPEPQPQPQPVAASSRILFVRNRQLVLIDPDGRNEKTISRQMDLYWPEDPKLSPDGKRIAYVITMHTPDDPVDYPPRMLHVRGLDEQEPATNLEVDCDSFAWSPDGTEIVYSRASDRTIGAKDVPMVHGIINVRTKAKTPLKLPADHGVLDWSRDGKTFLTERIIETTGVTTLHVMNRDGTERQVLTDPKERAAYGRLSPDGKRVLYVSIIPEKLPTGQESPNAVDSFKLRVLDLTTGQTIDVANVPKGGHLDGYCWSPDGKRIAYLWREFVEIMEAGLERDDEIRLIVCDPNGQNPVTIVTGKSKLWQTNAMCDVDWR